MCLGIPAKIVDIVVTDYGIVKVDVSGVKRIVNAQCIIEENHNLEEYINRWVLIHVGFAMALIDEDEAMRTLKLVEEMGELEVFNRESAGAERAAGEKEKSHEVRR